MNSPLVPTRFLEATLFGLCLLLIVIAYCARLYVPFTFGYADPGWQMAGVQSVAEDGDLDLRNQLNFDIKRTSGQVAAGRGGQWYPSHEIPIIFFATPFYRIWGFNGCLIANVVAALLMGLGSFLIARSFASFPASAGASLLAFLTTPCLTLAYSFSNDLFAASIFTWLLFALIRQRYWLVGILLGACLLSRLATVALIPAIGLYCLLVGSPRAAVRVMVPLALGGLCYGLINYQMFGSPLALAYERLVSDAPIHRTTSSLYFSYTLQGVKVMLLNQQQGILFAYPLLAAVIFISKVEIRLLCYGVLIGLGLLFAGHTSFNSVGGARYFLPTTPFIALGLAMALDGLQKLRSPQS